MKQAKFNLREVAVFSTLLILTHVFYYPTWNAGFVTDFTGLADRIEGSNVWGIFNSFGFPALQQVLNFFLYLFYKGFGVSPLPWYLVFTTMHVLNAWCLYRFSRHLLSLYQIKNTAFISIAGALFFLLLPYQSEVLTWRVCFNFLLCSLLIINSLWSISRWLETKENRFLWRSHLFFGLALFTFELSFSLPLIAGAYLLFWTFSQGERPLLSQRLLKLTVPHFLMVGAYFLLSRLVIGAWIGHYGASTHLRFSFPEITGNLFRYFVKTGFFVRYLEHPTKEMIFSFFDNQWALYVLLIILGSFLVEALIRFRKLSAKGQLTLFFLLSFFIALLPIINLYFNYLLFIENDRYGYLASMFFCVFLALVLSGLPKWWRYGLSLVFIFFCTLTLTKTNRFWKESTTVYRGLLNSFDYYDQGKVYLLNLPDNLMGAVLFRDFSGSDAAFEHALRFVKRKPFQGNIREVVQYNLTRPTNGVKVEQDSTNRLEVSFLQYGNWWWRRGQGAGSYENEDYKFMNQGDHYLLELKNPEENAIFLYQIENRWEQFTPDRSNWTNRQ